MASKMPVMSSSFQRVPISFSSYQLMLCFTVVSLLCIPRPVVGEMFTALVEMTRAFDVEESLADTLEFYADAEAERLQRVREFAQNLRKHAQTGYQSNAEKQISNPVNAFLFTKRFAQEMHRKLDELIWSHPTERPLQELLESRRDDLPGKDDLDGAANALLRLQDTYLIPTRSIAKGQVHPASISSEMSGDDCFLIGKYAYDGDDFYHAREWMSEALNRLEPYHGNKELNRSTILDYLSYITYKMGNMRQALVLTNEWLAIEPHEQRALTNKAYFEKQIDQDVSAGIAKKGDNSTESDDPAVYLGQPPQKNGQLPEFVNYEALCRDEDIIPIENRHLLTCRYYVPHPAYLIGPVKEEVMHLRPRIVVWYDIIHEQEIEKFKELATPRLNRATVQNAVTGKLEYAQYRISKSAWLAHELDELTAKTNSRISRLTGLDVETAEELQVVNYGIGGHYEPHFDFARRRERNSFEKAVGNRIATLLYYLSDIDAGGATVFVKLGVKLWPKKGAAAFWFNLKHNGEGDLSTRHAACPVLAGSKWVMNKWFHERGQEFRRRCALKNVDYEY